MRMILFLVMLAALVGAAAMLTKPSEADAEAALRDQLLLALAKEDLRGKSGPEQLAITLCRSAPNECYDLVRSQIETTFEDRTVYVAIKMTGFDKRATCYGAFGQFLCPGGLREE